MNRKVKDPNRLRGLEKFSFFLSQSATIPLNTVLGSYLLIFYTDVVGLPAGACATLFLISRLMDGINDPVCGFLMDRMKRTKFGKFRTLLIVGAIICGINYTVLFLGPAYLPESAKLITAYITYLVMGISYDFLATPSNCLLATVTNEPKDRSTLGFLSGLASMGSIVVGFALPIVVSSFASQLEGYTVFIVASAIVFTVLPVVGALGVKERVEPAVEQKYGLKDFLKLFGVGPLAAYLLIMLFNSISSGIYGSAATYYATYILGDFTLMSMGSLFMIVGMFAGLFIAGALAKRVSKRAVYAGAALLLGSVFLIRLFAPRNIPLFFTFNVFYGLGCGGIQALGFSMCADVIDYAEYDKHFRSEGAVASMLSFINKVGAAVGGAIPGYVLMLTNFVPNAEQSAEASLGIMAIAIILPAIFNIGAGIVAGLGYKIDEKTMLTVSEELARRKTDAEKA